MFCFLFFRFNIKLHIKNSPKRRQTISIINVILIIEIICLLFDENNEVTFSEFNNTCINRGKRKSGNNVFKVDFLSRPVSVEVLLQKKL